MDLFHQPDSVAESSAIWRSCFPVKGNLKQVANRLFPNREENCNEVNKAIYDFNEA
jgi:hypothetical protein